MHGISSSDVWKFEAINQQRNFFSYAEFYSSLSCLKFLKENPFGLYAQDSDVKSCLGDLFGQNTLLGAVASQVASLQEVKQHTLFFSLRFVMLDLS